MQHVMKDGKRLPEGRGSLNDARSYARREIDRLPAHIRGLEPARPPYRVAKESAAPFATDPAYLASRPSVSRAHILLDLGPSRRDASMKAAVHPAESVADEIDAMQRQSRAAPKSCMTAVAARSLSMKSGFWTREGSDDPASTNHVPQHPAA
jgi:hypothetical protein